MPRKVTFDKDAVLSSIIKNKEKIYDSERKKFFGPLQECWKEVVKLSGQAVSAKTVYTIVLQNRYKIHESLALNPTKPIETEESSSEESTEAPVKSCVENPIHFIVTLGCQEWRCLETDVQYHRADRSTSRTYKILEPRNWTQVFHEHFYNVTSLPCSLSYKRCKITPSGKVYLRVEGKCLDCHSVLVGEVHPPLQEDVPINVKCTYTGAFRLCEGGSKRQIIGRKRSEYRENMLEKNMSATYLRRIEAKNIMTCGDMEPSHIPNLSTLRNIKYKAKMEEIIHKDAVVAVCLLKEFSPYRDIIKSIGYDKFFIHYWSTSELSTYRKYTENNATPKISIDATGSLVKSIPLLSGRKTSAIFLYEIAVMDEKSGSQFTVAHMLSERHNNNAISFWLSEWIRSDIKIPKIVVTDQSLALMMAVVKSFTQYSTLKQYLRVCSLIILNTVSPNDHLPTTFLRNDFNHVMKLISSWPEIKSSHRRIKNFYLRSIGLVISSTDFDDIKTLLKMIFIVALHEEDGDNAAKRPTACENAKQFLKNRIETHEKDVVSEIIDDDEDDARSDIVDDPDDPDDPEVAVDFSNTSDFGTIEDPNTNIFSQIKDLFKSVEETKNTMSNKGDHDNMQYNPPLAKRLLKFCDLLPCWTAVMVPFFDYGNTTETSASSESCFNDLKTRVLQHKTLPLRLDEFIKLHINSITGSINLVNANKEYRKFENVESGETKIEQTNITKIEQAVENWRGEGDANEHLPLKKRKLNYLAPDPSIKYMNEENANSKKVVGIIKNGNTMSLKSVTIQDEDYVALNTCPFDTIFQILCVAYVERPEYAAFVDKNVVKRRKKNTNISIFDTVVDAVHHGITRTVYEDRVKLLLRALPERKEKSNNIFTLNTATTAKYIISKLLSRHPSLTENRECDACHKSKEFQSTDFAIELPNTNSSNMNRLQQFVTMYFEEDVNCFFCGRCTGKRNIRLGEHLFIEILLPIIGENEEYLDVSLNSIPLELSVRGKRYFLVGVVSFLAPPKSNKNSARNAGALGHFIAHCWRQSTGVWEKYDDRYDSGGCKTTRSTTIVNCQFVIYVI